MIEKGRNSEHSNPRKIKFRFGKGSRDIPVIRSIQPTDHIFHQTPIDAVRFINPDQEKPVTKNSSIITSIRELPTAIEHIKNASPAEIKLSERNKHVPFPELNKKEGLLERVVLDMGKDNLSSYEDLPETITAGNIEAYANWLSKLTEKDAQGAERGTVLHVPINSKDIIFPTDLNVGEKTDGGWSVDWTLAKERNLFVPTINLHSHPVDICHSSTLGDMGTLIAGWDADNFAPPGMIVATSGHNYLMLKSRETPPVKDKWEAYQKANDMAGEYYDMLRFLRFGTPIGQSMESSTYWELYKRAEKQTLGWEHGFEVYYKNFTDGMNLADAYKLGFYRSNKDGVYKRFTQEEIKGHMTDFITTALRSAI